MVENLRQFMLAKSPSSAQAVQTLRAVFLAMFLTQVGLALLLGVIFMLAGRSQSTNPLLAQAFIFISLLLLPISLFGSSQLAAAGGKQAALSATLLNAVVLSTPAWFLGFALAVGTSSPYLLILAAVLTLFYALGLLSVNAFARAALVQPKHGELETKPLNEIKPQG